MPVDHPDRPADEVAPGDARPDRIRQLYLLVGASCLAVLLLGVVWLLVTGLLARSRLNDAQSEVRALRRALAAGDTVRAGQLADHVRATTASAHALTSGPAWWVAASIPVAGTPVRATRVIATQTKVLGNDVVPRVVDLADNVAHAARPGGGVGLAPLERTQPVLRAATQAVDRASASVAATPGSWFGPVGSARTSLLAQLAQTDDQLRGAQRAVRLALPMLGEQAPRRYFIGFLNEAEARGVGGIPGAFAVATVDRGHLTFEHFGSDTELAHVRARVDLGTEFEARYGQDDPAGIFANSDISPDFSDAARIWAALWQAKTGQHVDGALAIDPTALRYLLRAEGDRISSATDPVAADNVVALTQQTQYARFPGLSPQANAQRKQFLISVARAVAARLTHGSNLRGLAQAASLAAHERRLTVWSANPGEERELRESGYAGSLAAGPGPFTGWSIVNAAGSKLDYYDRTTMTYVRGHCTAGSSATASIRVTNSAPRTGLPRYVTLRADEPRYPTHPGDNLVLLTYYGTPGSRVRSVTLDGRTMPVSPGTENGLTAVTVAVELPAQRTRTLRVELTEPAVHGPVRVLRQPAVRPVAVATHTGNCR
ncbi:DUF4012 domain-containing protein [uncultured Jatrophihabitans sp.]|uniref:DUF4012 domain-containing protein n=1 Tax=uncultured Jatrophihabitans sp. TaxID=1610747 RepID=UPI0035CA3525